MGFLILCSKITSRIFYKKVPENHKVILYKQPLERGVKFKYLGMWLDSKLTWKHHIDYMETKCKKVLNVMRMVSGLCWGADRQSMLNIYKALIRSTVDYGCVVYSSACKTSLLKLERIQCKALRIALGAMKTTPTSALLVESEENPLSLRYRKISLTYWHRRRLRGGWGGHVSTTIYNLNFVPTTFKNVQTNCARKNPHILNQNRQV